MYSNDDLAIIILDYNKPDLTNRCLESIWRYNRVKIVLVNSGSTEYEEYDRSIPFLYVINHRGRSFSIGMNTGFKAASSLNSKYVIFMNNDAILTGEAVRLLVNALQSNSKLGMVSSGYRYSLGFLNKERSLDLTLHDTDQPKIRLRKMLTGFCLCARFEAISAIGGYDENFLFTKEDDDLSIRLIKKGYILGEVENSVVIHKISSSTNFSEEHEIHFLSTSFGIGCGLLVNKKERYLISMLTHLVINDVFLFIKIIILTQKFKFDIFKWSLNGFKNGISKNLDSSH